MELKFCSSCQHDQHIEGGRHVATASKHGAKRWKCAACLTGTVKPGGGKRGRPAKPQQQEDYELVNEVDDRQYLRDCGFGLNRDGLNA